MGERRLLTIPEAADEIGMSRVVLWRLVKRGVVPSVPAGRFRLIDADELAEFAKQDRPQGWPKGRKRRPPTDPSP
jgi:excisionase family DNA binding protein